MGEHHLEVKVYLEDTDAEGIVYHANYLKYFERARSEILEARGLPLSAWSHQDRLFVVHEMTVKFQRPARLGDRIGIRTTHERASEYRVSFHQEARRVEGDLPLVVADVQVVCVDRQGNLAELPDGVDL